MTKPPAKNWWVGRFVHHSHITLPSRELTYPPPRKGTFEDHVSFSHRIGRVYRYMILLMYSYTFINGLDPPNHGFVKCVWQHIFGTSDSCQHTLSTPRARRVDFHTSPRLQRYKYTRSLMDEMPCTHLPGVEVTKKTSPSACLEGIFAPLHLSLHISPCRCVVALMAWVLCGKQSTHMASMASPSTSRILRYNICTIPLFTQK